MSKKILIIDDEKDLTELLSFRLGNEGFECVTAFDGEDGIEKMKTERPDLVILDLLMPRADGYEVIRRLKGDPATLDTPIIVLTAAATSNLEENIFHAGATDCVIKPFEPSELIGKIRKVLDE